MISSLSLKKLVSVAAALCAGLLVFGADQPPISQPILMPPQFAGKPLRVVTRVLPPFVMQSADGKLSGFSMDLWNEIAKRLNVASDFSVVPTVDDLITQVNKDKADVAVCAITITSARDVLIDFSQPMYESGLQIAVRDTPQQHESELSAIWDVLTSSAMLHLLGVMLIAGVVIAHIVWLVERRHEEGGVVEHKKYFPGIIKALWWSMGTIGSQVDEMPRTWLGRMIAVFWMFCAIVFVTYFTAAATTNLTVKSLGGSIHGPSDLPGKKVATTRGSTSAAYLHQHDVKVTEVQAITDAWPLLASGKVEAVVFDAPVLQYYAANDGAGKVAIVGDVFQKQNYGIVVANDSLLRDPINVALLQIQEDGTYDNLMNKWFNAPSDSGQ